MSCFYSGLCYSVSMAEKLIFIDDAGDPGFKFGRGSTNYFVVAAVFFDDNLDAEEVALKIKRLRRDLNWHDLHEFKFRKTSAAIRTRFFKAVRPLKFRVVVALIDKRTITDKEFQKNPGKFYNAVILRAIGVAGNLQKAHICIDGEKGNDYRRKAKVLFRQNLPQYSVKELTFKDSRKDNLLQLADMIAGAALHSTEKRPDADAYISLVKKRIETTITML